MRGPARRARTGSPVRRGLRLTALLVASLAAASCSEVEGRGTGTVLVVAQKALSPSEAGVRSRLVVLDAGGEGAPRPLTEDLHAARAPAVSPDGRRVVFVGRRSADDPWQLWEKEIDGGTARRVPWEGDRPDDPAYLADGRVVFSGRPPGGGDGGSGTGSGADGGTARALFTVDPEGSGARRITFHPVSDRSPTVLPDGRVLFVSGLPGDARLLTVRSDGTGVRLFYPPGGQGRRLDRPRPGPEGQVVFVEPRDEAGGGALVSVSSRRPLNTRRELSAGIPGRFRSVAPLPSGKLAVSYDAFGSGEPAVVRELDPSRGLLGPPVLRDSRFHAVDVAASAPGPDPKSFVSVVDTSAAETGKLFCVDANLSGRPEEASPEPEAVAVRITTPGGPLGRVPLESDGSFFVELPADTPVRFVALDGAGDTVRGPSSWIWVRPNESRGCVGCHESRQRTPPNRVPAAVEGEPVAPERGDGIGDAAGRDGNTEREGDAP